jgi:hypothetical protein
MLATLVCAVLGAVFDRTSMILAGLAPLIIAIAWTGLSDKHDLDRRLDQLRQAIGIALFAESDDIYRDGKQTLEEARGNGGWETVRIYAPSGLWATSPSKDAWLATLSRELGSSVGNVSAVCGLPREGTAFRDVAWPLLRTFADTPGTELRYLPPDRTDNPPAALGVGIAIFENRRLGRYRVIFGFAGRDTAYGQQLVAGGFVVDSAVVGPLVADWFDHRVMRYCAKFVIRGADPARPGVEAKMAEQFEAIRQMYYADTSMGAAFK